MSDWPILLDEMPGGAIHSSSLASLASDPQRMYGGIGTGSTWPAANRALYVPVMVAKTVTAYKMGFEVTVQSGNCDVGIYDGAGNRLVSSGSTAVAAAGAQVIDISDTLLTPGVYYMALCVDNTTAAVIRSGQNAMAFQVCGLQQQDLASVTLPNPATFANPVANYLPGISIALAATM